MGRRIQWSLGVVAALAAALTVVRGAGAFGAPEELLSGLAQPGDVAVDPFGNVWFTQLTEPMTVHPTTVAIARLAPGASAPETMFTWSGTRPSVTNLQFDAAGHAYYLVSRDLDVGRGYRIGGLGRIFGTVAVGGDSVLSPLTSGSTIDLLGQAPDGTLIYTSRAYDSGLGRQIAQVFALPLDAETPSLIASFTAGSFDVIVGLAVASDGTIYVLEGATGVSWNVFRIAPGGVPQSVLSVPMSDPVTPRPSWIGLDGADGLIVGRRAFSGHVFFGCADATMIDFVRFDAATLESGVPVGEVVSTGMHPGYGAIFLQNSRTLFHVTSRGDVFYGLFPLQSRCTLPAPIRAASLDLWGVDASDATGAHVRLFNDVPPSPVDLDPISAPHLKGPYGIGSDGYHVYYASTRLGTLSRISLAQTAETLIALVRELNLSQGLEDSLEAKVANVQRALDSQRPGNATAACRMLDAFTHEVDAQAQAGALSPYDADGLRAAANAVKTANGCS